MIFEIHENPELDLRLREELRKPYDNTEDEKFEAELERKKNEGEKWEDEEW